MYVSARYAPSDDTIPAEDGDPRQVIATDDQGVEWYLTEDSQVGNWLRFTEAGGTIEPASTDTPEGA